MTTLLEHSTELSFEPPAPYTRIAITKSGYIHALLRTPMQPKKVARWKPDNLEKEINKIKSLDPMFIGNYIRVEYQN